MITEVILRKIIGEIFEEAKSWRRILFSRTISDGAYAKIFNTTSKGLSESEKEFLLNYGKIPQARLEGFLEELSEKLSEES